MKFLRLLKVLRFLRSLRFVRFLWFLRFYFFYFFGFFENFVFFCWKFWDLKILSSFWIFRVFFNFQFLINLSFFENFGFRKNFVLFWQFWVIWKFWDFLFFYVFLRFLSDSDDSNEIRLQSDGGRTQLLFIFRYTDMFSDVGRNLANLPGVLFEQHMLWDNIEFHSNLILVPHTSWITQSFLEVRVKGDIFLNIIEIYHNIWRKNYRDCWGFSKN